MNIIKGKSCILFNRKDNPIGVFTTRVGALEWCLKNRLTMAYNDTVSNILDICGHKEPLNWRNPHPDFIEYLEDLCAERGYYVVRYPEGVKHLL